MTRISVLRLLFFACIVQAVHGENKRLVCKTAGTDFGENYPEVQSETDANTNYITLNASIETIADRVIKKMQTMEERIFKKLHTAILEARDLEGLQDAIIFRGRKYWTVLHGGSFTRYEEAEMICKLGGGRPADILGDDDFKAINEHITATMSNDISAASVWLGMKFDYVTKEVNYFGGDTAPQFHWYPGHPTSSRYTHIGLTTHRDPSNKNQGIFIYSHTSQLRGVVCQK